jgi:putative oxidoreductase
MSVLRALGRPAIASIFIIQGLETMRRPERVAKRAEPVVQSLAEVADFLPRDAEQAVRINGAIQFAAGTLLAIGWAPRLAALAIAGTLVPTTAAGHRYWEEDEPQERTQQRIHFMKNLSMLGGLLIAAADNGGRPSLAWQGRYRYRSARRQFSSAKRVARIAGKAGAKAGRVRGRIQN